MKPKDISSSVGKLGAQNQTFKWALIEDSRPKTKSYKIKITKILVDEQRVILFIQFLPKTNR